MPKTVNFPEKLRFRAPRGTTQALEAYARRRSFRRPDGQPDCSAAIRELLGYGRRIAEQMQQGATDDGQR